MMGTSWAGLPIRPGRHAAPGAGHLHAAAIRTEAAGLADWAERDQDIMAVSCSCRGCTWVRDAVVLLRKVADDVV